MTTGVYIIFGLCAFWVFHFLGDGSFSVICTLSSMFQCLAFVLLVIQSEVLQSVHGISAQSLKLDALALCCRLASTLFKQSYLPIDRSGDWAYQMADIASLAVVLSLLYRMCVRYSSSYQSDSDKMPVTPLILTCFILAVLLRANRTKSIFFDTMWMANLFLSAVAVLPQLWLITANGGRAGAITSHSIAAAAVGRILSGVFVWRNCRQITSTPWIEGINHAPPAILGVHVIHFVLVLDFGYHYLKAVTKGQVSGEMKFDDILDLDV